MAAATTLTTQNKVMTPRQREGSKVQWVYLDRFEVCTQTKEEAIKVLQQFGFTMIVHSEVKHKASKRPVPISTDYERAK